VPKTSLPADSICSGLGRGAEDYTNLAAERAQLADREPRVDRSPREPDARRTLGARQLRVLLLRSISIVPHPCW
jgi:hypothetical protein